MRVLGLIADRRRPPTGAVTTSVPARRLALPLCLAVLLAAVACTAPTQTESPPPLVVGDVLGAAAPAGFARAFEPRVFDFPADHGPHPDFAAEWWYVTGNLSSADGRQFGYQLTFFRTALAPPDAASERGSRWATDQVWMAHFAFTDAEGEQFFAFERFQRQALGLAGAGAEPWRVWLDDWSLEQIGDSPFPLRLRAQDRDDRPSQGGGAIGIDLRLTPSKPLVLQGDRGLSTKGPSPGNASYYYSFTRLDTVGSVRVGDLELEVTGSSWLDREWSTSALEGDQVGWDWFALQLDDGRELMFYQLRRQDGSAAPQSAGVLVDADGSSARLTSASVGLEVDRTWRSPRFGTLYPAAWTLTVGQADMTLFIEPLLEDQELDLAFRYWEGAVRVTGTGSGGTPINGRGYVELTGYADGGRTP